MWKKFADNDPLRHTLGAGLIAIALFIAYVNTFHSPFYFDDYGYVIGNPWVEISSISLESLKNAALKTPGEARDLGNISFALNHYFLGSDVFGFHLINFFIHLGSALTAYFFFKTLALLPGVKEKGVHYHGVALLAALLWAVHPLHTNSVTYIVQRLNSLAGFFCLLSLLLYAHGRTVSVRWKRLLFFFGVFLFGLAAIFCKENAMMLPVMIAGYELFFLSVVSKRKNIKGIMVFIGVAFLLLLSFIFLYKGGNFFFFLSGYANKDFTLFQRLLTEPRVIFFYLSLLVLLLPGRLNLLHDFSLSTTLFSPPQTFFALGIIVTLFFSIFWFYKRDKVLAFALFWFLGNLAY